MSKLWVYDVGLATCNQLKLVAEVNINPSLSSGSPLDKRIKTKLVEYPCIYIYHFLSMGRDLLKVLAACGPEGPAVGPKGPQRARRARTWARRAREGERSETVLPEATD